MSRFAPYAGALKSAGEHHIGDVPVHWSVLALKRGATILSGSTPKSGVEEYWDGDVAWVTPADLSSVNGGTISAGARSLTTAGYESCGTSLVAEGSVVLSTRAPIGTLALSTASLCTNQGCKSLVTEAFDAKFLLYTLLISTTELNIRGRGTTFLELSTGELGAFRVCGPPLEEQTQIAKFLDYETARIDALIDKQQQLIALLKEKRQAVISHAVTKGLNPDAPMKDSGVEWLGEVPAHWEVGRYKNLFKIDQGVAFKSSEYVDDSNVISVRMGNIKKGGNLDLEHKVVHLPSSYAFEFARYALKDGDLIIAMTDMSPLLEFLAVPARMEGLDPERVYLLNQRVGKLTINGRCDSEYLKFALLSDGLRTYLKAIGLGTVQANMSNSDLYGAHIAIPPLQEQRYIAESLGQQIAKMDGLAARQHEAIGLMQERRTALISAAVTGKIDVRNWKASETDKEVA